MGGTPLRVLIAMPSHGDVKAGAAWSLARAVNHFNTVEFEGDKEIDAAIVKGSILPEVRTRCVMEAMKREASHLLFVDGDMTFPEDVIARLLNHNKLIVGANYARKDTEGGTTAYCDNDDFTGPLTTTEADQDLMRVKFMGLGLCLIDMRVFDAIELPYFNFTPALPHNAVFKGEDVFFFQKCSDAGIEAYVDQALSFHVGHVGDFTYTHTFANACKQTRLQKYEAAE